MAEGKIGEFTWKPPASKEELEGGPFGIIGGVNTETLPTHSMLHLPILQSKITPKAIDYGWKYAQKKAEPFLTLPRSSRTEY